MRQLLEPVGAVDLSDACGKPDVDVFGRFDLIGALELEHADTDDLGLDVDVGAAQLEFLANDRRLRDLEGVEERLRVGGQKILVGCAGSDHIDGGWHSDSCVEEDTDLLKSCETRT